MTDRLADIKRRAAVIPSYADTEWLIAEVERLRSEITIQRDENKRLKRERADA